MAHALGTYQHAKNCYPYADGEMKYLVYDPKANADLDGIVMEAKHIAKASGYHVLVPYVEVLEITPDGKEMDSPIPIRSIQGFIARHRNGEISDVWYGECRPGYSPHKSSAKKFTPIEKKALTVLLDGKTSLEDLFANITYERALEEEEKTALKAFAAPKSIRIDIHEHKKGAKTHTTVSFSLQPFRTKIEPLMAKYLTHLADNSGLQL